MHIQETFAMGDLEMARGVVRQYPFATLVTADLRATHMPEAAVAEPWSLDRAGESARDMADQVIAFRLRADSWHAEAKLSQDKPGDERARVLAGLEHDPAYSNPRLAKLMRRLG